MTTHDRPAGPAHRPPPAADGDAALLPGVVAAVRAAGAAVARTFRPDARPADLDRIVTALRANDEAAEPLRRHLAAVRPGAGWDDDEDGEGPLPPGEWWVADAVEGNINHVHGVPEFCTSATLVRDDVPVLTAVHVPLTGHTYTAVAGGGAYRDGTPLRVSAKTSLSGAVVTASQNGAHEAPAPARAIGRLTTALLDADAIVRVSPPPTLHLLAVAAGHADAFVQFGAARAGLVAGALLVAEAGGRVTDVRGEPWRPDRADFLAAAPGVHAAVADLAAGGTALAEPRWTHVGLPVSDLERSVEFYEKLTSLVVVRREERAGLRSAWLSNPGQAETPSVLVLGQFDEEYGTRFGVPSDGRRIPILAPWAHLGIEVPARADVDRIAARAHELGTPPRWEPTDMGGGIGYTTAVSDPDGNTVEFAHDQKVFSTVRELWG